MSKGRNKVRSWSKGRRRCRSRSNAKLYSTLVYSAIFRAKPYSALLYRAVYRTKLYTAQPSNNVPQVEDQ